MTQRYPLLYQLLRALGGLVIALGLWGLDMPEAPMYLLVVGLILLVGIPHGATDYLIFRHLTKPFWGTRSLRRFYVRYVALMLGYAAVWWAYPLLALAIFLLLSMYHFGQSNWHYAQQVPSRLKGFAYLVWGGFVVLGPVLGHYDQTAPIIERLIGTEAPDLPLWFRLSLIGLLFGLSLLIPSLFVRKGYLTVRESDDERANLLVLAGVFATTPALLGFTVYFVGWHSLTSIMDQVDFFRRRIGVYSLRDYARATVPLTLLSLAGLGLLAGGQRLIGLDLGIGVLFVFISIVTLPHMILLDRLYAELEEEGPGGEPLTDQQ